MELSASVMSAKRVCFTMICLSALSTGQICHKPKMQNYCDGDFGVILDLLKSKFLNQKETKTLKQQFYLIG